MNRKLSMMILTLLLALTVTACSCSTTNTGNKASPKPPAVTATPLPSPVQTPEVSPTAPEGTPGGMTGDMNGATADGMNGDTAGDMPQIAPEGGPEQSPGSANGPTMVGIDVSKLITELEKLSEVDTAAVVAQGGRAVVGLNFDAQYQGTLTDRIEEMVISAVSSVESMLTDVAVTADPALIEQIRALASDTDGKEMTADQITQFDEIYRKIKPEKNSENTAQ